MDSCFEYSISYLIENPTNESEKTMIPVVIEQTSRGERSA